MPYDADSHVSASEDEGAMSDASGADFEDDDLDSDTEIRRNAMLRLNAAAPAAAISDRLSTPAATEYATGDTAEALKPENLGKLLMSEFKGRHVSAQDIGRALLGGKEIDDDFSTDSFQCKLKASIALALAAGYVKRRTTSIPGDRLEVKLIGVSQEVGDMRHILKNSHEESKKAVEDRLHKQKWARNVIEQAERDGWVCRVTTEIRKHKVKKRCCKKAITKVNGGMLQSSIKLNRKRWTKKGEKRIRSLIGMSKKLGIPVYQSLYMRRKKNK